MADAVELDMAPRWKPSVDTFLGRVTKARILQAVSEAKGERAADRIAHLKKGEMATEAETLLVDTGWLPDALRSPGQTAEVAVDSDASVEETASAEGETAVAEEGGFTDDDDTDVAAMTIAAE